MKLKITLLGLIIILSSCTKDNVLPKQHGFLSLDFPTNSFSNIETTAYKLGISNKAEPFVNEQKLIKINYPTLKAMLSITYRPIENNLDTLFFEAKKITTKHSKKAGSIYFNTFENEDERVFAQITNVTGNVASPLQFLATDKEKHFLTGSLYFKTTPNYDSIYPAIKYIEKDILHLIETLKWKN